MAVVNKMISSLKLLSFQRILPKNARSIITNYTNEEIPENVIKMREKDAIVEMNNPFEKTKEQCILCKYQIQPDYKNVRLLSQFISPFTGRVYGRHITALCEKKQFRVEREVLKATRAGFLAGYLKDPVFYKDPKLYDPENPIRPHKY